MSGDCQSHRVCQGQSKSVGERQIVSGNVRDQVTESFKECQIASESVKECQRNVLVSVSECQGPSVREGPGILQLDT